MKTYNKSFKFVHGNGQVDEGVCWWRSRLLKLKLNWAELSGQFGLDEAIDIVAFKSKL